MNITVKGLNGRPYKIQFKLKQFDNSSQYHALCDEILKDLAEKYYQEVRLPGSGGLRADFFLPLRNLMIEVHGPQHYEYIQHFHKTKMGFLNSLKRDKDKRKWCDINNITLLELSYNDTDNWRDRVFKVITEGKTNRGGNQSDTDESGPSDNHPLQES